ncbi:MAG: hypothetical protein WDO70_02140 [Alphaproteobacteria bacterium]
MYKAPPEVLKRAIDDGFPLDRLADIDAPVPILPPEIEELAREALFGDKESGGRDRLSFGGIQRYIEVGDKNPFIDPAGILGYRLVAQEREAAQNRGGPQNKAAPVAKNQARRAAATPGMNFSHQPAPPTSTG